jgi:KDO2-lipid IV(A) lauroyltransferase
VEENFREIQVKMSFIKLRRKFYYFSAFIFSRGALAFPYKFSVGVFSAFFGRIAYYAVYSATNIAKRNLRKCFPEKSENEIIKITKEVFCNMTKNFFEVVNFPRMSQTFLKNISSVDGSYIIEKSIKKRKGILFVSAHTGNWEITAASIASLGVPVNVVAKKIYIDGLNNMLVKYRMSKRINVILRNASDAGTKLLKVLRKGEIIAMLIDQDTNVPGVFVDFFGDKAWTSSGFAVLALKTGADVLVGLDQRVDKYRHKTVIKGPLSIESSEDFNKDVEILTQKASFVLEEHIRQYPEQWVWFHKRWKTRPEK